MKSVLKKDFSLTKWKVSGQHNEYFPIRYSQLSPEALRKELLKRYELEAPITCNLFDYGMNDIYIVKSQKENYYLRISLADMHKSYDYEEEIAIINELCKKGIRAAAPVCCRDGSFMWEINAPEGKRYVVLFTEAKSAPSEEKVKMVYNLGCMVAEVHRIADEKDFKVSRAPIDLVQLAEKPLKMIHPYLAHRPSDDGFLNTAAEKLCMYVKENFGYDKPYYGYCHGDIHTGNVIFDGVTPTIFDFDCMGYGWRAYDICIFAWNENFSNEKYTESEEWKAFLEGYSSVRTLSEVELAAIPAFAALRQLWMIGLHADVMERNAGCCWYNDEYFDNQIGIFKRLYERAFPKL